MPRKQRAKCAGHWIQGESLRGCTKTSDPDRSNLGQTQMPAQILGRPARAGLPANASEKVAQHRDEALELVVMEPVARVFELDHSAVAEVLDAPVTLRIAGP